MPDQAHNQRRTSKLAIASLGLFAAGSLCAFQFGDHNELNGMTYPQVQALSADLTKARAMAQQGNIDFFAEVRVSGRPVRLRGEITDANCYLATRAHAYDHAFCAKLCAATGSALLFVADDHAETFVVLTGKNAVKIPDVVLNQIGVPGILVQGQIVESSGIHALAIEDLAH
jgi:hypothetical protein